jgi:hypothetical protein
MPRFVGFLVVASVLLFSQTTSATSPFHLWSKRFVADTNTQVAEKVSTDSAGNIAIAGWFQGTVNFGGSDLTSAAGYDVYVAKFDANGNHLWSFRYGGASDQLCVGVDFDGAGNVIVAGYFAGSIDFGGGALNSMGGNDVFVAKLNSNGSHVWSFRYGDGSGQLCESVEVDAAGNVHVTGNFQGSINFGGGAIMSGGGDDVYLAKLNSAGAHQWSKGFGDVSLQRVGALAIDSSSNVVIAGINSGTVNFGGSPITTAGSNDIFIAKFNSGGTHLFSAGYGDASGQASNALTFDSAGNLLFAGTFAGTVNFGGAPLTSAGSNDLCLVKFSAANTHVWSYKFGDNLDNGSFGGLGVDGNDVLVACGSLQNTVNFGTGVLTSSGSNDVFHARFDANGICKASDRSGDANNNICRSIAVDALGSVLIFGDFEGILDFGGGPLVAAGADLYLARFAPFVPLIESITDVGNDQGRNVRIRFARSGLDGPGSPTPILHYVAFRRIDDVAAASPRDPDGNASRYTALDGWEFAASIPAFAENEYSMIAPTLADSTITDGQYYSAFFVRAATGNPAVFVDSPIDSGYSLDNLSPSVPTGFTYAAGMLTWDESNAADFDYFSVYGSGSGTFDGSAVLIDYTVGTNLDVSASPYAFYFVTATDFSGNEGGAAIVDALTDADGVPTPRVLSVSAYPNPFNPNTTVRYTLPAKGRVNLVVFDLRGSHVATLVDDVKDAGAFTATWNGRDDRGGGAASGVYFARLAFGGEVRTYKLVLLK